MILTAISAVVENAQPATGTSFLRFPPEVRRIIYVELCGGRIIHTYDFVESGRKHR